MRAKAVISREVNKPVVVEEIEVAAPRTGEVMVKLAACGVCATAICLPPTAPFRSRHR